MRGRLSILFASVLLAAPTVLVTSPAASAGPDPSTPLAVPAPRVGDVVTMRYDGGATQTYRWAGPAVPMADGFGVERLVSPVVLEECGTWGCSESTLWVDLEHRDVVAVPTSLGTATRSWTTLYGETFKEERVEHDMDALRKDPVAFLQFSLQGRTLAPGGSYVRETPPFPWFPESRTTVTYHGVGWEDVDGASLFRVDVVMAFENPAGASTFTYWYDGAHHLPALSRWEIDTPEGPFAWERRLTSAGSGSGAVLAAPADAPGYVSSHVDAPTTTYTPDGPAEPILGSLSLQAATATARREPEASAWFALHPEAFLLGAEFQENAWTGLVEWVLVYLDGRDVLEVVVAAPYVPDQRTPDELATVTGVTNETLSASATPIPASLIVGQEVACGAHAREVAAAATPQPDGGRTGIRVTGGAITPLAIFVVDGAPVSLAVGCTVHVARHENDVALGLDLATGPGGEDVEAVSEESWPEASATVFARGGCVLVVAAGTATSSTSLRAGGSLLEAVLESAERDVRELLPS